MDGAWILLAMIEAFLVEDVLGKVDRRVHVVGVQEDESVCLIVLLFFGFAEVASWLKVLLTGASWFF